MIHLFISRYLDTHSPINFLVEKNFVITAESLIEFDVVSVQQPTTDWVFFYSKKGIDCYFDQHLEILDHQRVACFGEQTALYLTYRTSINAHFVGTGEAHTTRDKWRASDLKGSICFVRGELSRRSIIDELKSDHTIQELVIYRQRIKQITLSKEYDIAVLTSPLNVQGFFANGGNASHFIAIGPTTADELMRYNKHVIIAASPSESSLLECLLAHIESSMEYSLND